MQNIKTADTSKLMLASLEKVLTWVDLNGWATYDKIDIGEINFLQNLKYNSSFSSKLLCRFIYELEFLSPGGVRKFWGIKKQITAGGVAHLASGYIALYEKLGWEDYLPKAKQALIWLKEHSLSGYGGYAWGFPFDWNSAVLLPAGTPLSHTIVTCAMPFVDMFDLTKESLYLEIAESAIHTITNDLNRHQYDHGLITYAYTPLDQMEVLNTNLDVAWLFYRTSKYTENNDILEKARMISKWVVEEQQEDGSWYYFSSNFSQKNSRLPNVIDSYHTGMVLRALLHITMLENHKQLKLDYWSSFTKGLIFYLDNFFGGDGVPYLYPQNQTIIDVYSSPQAIIFLSELVECDTLPIDPNLLERIKRYLKQIFTWTYNNLQSPSGAFWCRKKYGFTYKLFSLRWGTALMINALANALYILERENGTK